jgi:3-dehydroshikimate dehydratase
VKSIRVRSGTTNALVRVRGLFYAITVGVAISHLADGHDGISGPDHFAGDSADLDVRETLLVTSAADDGSKGTLRWALNRSNSAPGKYRVVLQPPPGGDLVIRPRTLLPPIVGPALIIGPWYGGTHAANVIIDGSPLLDLSVIGDEVGDPKACPGEEKGYGPNVHSLQNPALSVTDTRDVELTGFEIRNFCIGVLSLRSMNTNIHHMRFESNLGAAAVVLTGDDGKHGGVALGTSHDNVIEHNYFINNSDTIDVVRGDTNSRIRFNTLVIDGTGLAVPSSGIEINNKATGTLIEGNSFRGYAGAIEIYQDGVTALRNVISGNVIGIQVRGNKNVFVGNEIYDNRVGIGIRPGSTSNTVSENRLYGNGTDFSYCAPGSPASGVCLKRDWAASKVTLTMNYPVGVRPNDDGSKCADKLPDCDGTQNYPIIERAAWQLPGVLAEGKLESRPNQLFIVEFFVSRAAGPGDFGEAEEFIGAIKVFSDSKGVAMFSLPPSHSLRGLPLLGGAKNIYLTSTATNAVSGATSELSRPIALSIP